MFRNDAVRGALGYDDLHQEIPSKTHATQEEIDVFRLFLDDMSVLSMTSNDNQEKKSICEYNSN